MNVPTAQSRLTDAEKPDLIPARLEKHRNVSASAADVLLGAGELLLNHFEQVSSIPKCQFDLVTSADTVVEKFMVGEIQGRFPEHQIIAEESTGPGTDRIEEFCWVIDPLDGTVNFAMGIPFFSISLALLHEGDSLLGWVYDPVHGELFEAQRGAGSFLNGQRLVVPRGNASPVPIGGSSGLLNWARLAGRSSPLLSMMHRFGKIRILGSQALHLCYVATGRLWAAISLESRLWDDAAGALIVQEAGARYTDFWGRDVFPLQPGSPILAGSPIHSVAAPPAIHREMLAILAGAPANEDGTELEEVAH